jgi:D-proline reductase (dithiol) PrdB
MTDVQAPREVDPWRFAGSFLKNVLGARIPKEPNHPPIPWAPVSKPLGESKVALLSTAGISMQGDEPFDMEGERKRPTWGDPSFRKIRADATGDSIDVNHLHIDTSYIKADINVALPLDRLRELVADGRVGGIAETHYSTMGYQGADTKVLENETAPAIAESAKREHVDLVLLAPV